MEDTNALIEQRKAKLAALRAKGIDPFRNKFTPAETCAEARARYAEGREVALAGRITAHRNMGKSMFLDIKDQSGRLQVYAQKNVLGDDLFEIFSHLDLGDFLGVRGTLFTTKTGEISVKLQSFVILAKALRPPPEKWHGLAETEIRYRQRYLDLIASDEVKRVFVQRSAVVRAMREFLHTRGYLEVETPMMQAIPGGAAAQPFVTHHNALGCDFYLRIALELYLKRLLVGGLDKVFEIGRNFRNEGLSRRHNPEFTMIEAYQAYGDYESMMELVQAMVCHVAQTVLGTLVIEHSQDGEVASVLRTLNLKLSNLRARLTGDPPRRPDSQAAFDEMLGSLDQQIQSVALDPLLAPHQKADKVRQNLSQYLEILNKDASSGTPRLLWTEEIKDLLESTDESFSFKGLLDRLAQLAKLKTIDLTPPWRRVTYKDLVREKAGADWFEATPAARRERAVQLGAEIATGYEDFEVTHAVFEKLIEPTLVQPTFVTHAPKELVPLAKLSPEDPTAVEVFECCINGQEIAPGYTEQNDPIEQRERLEHQAGGEQQKLDEDFLVALEHGMPPAGGIGLGIDRLCMMLLGQESIRDVILFPQLRPK